jgi:hypothetical protein
MGMLDIGQYWVVFLDKKKWDRAKHRQNPETFFSLLYTSHWEGNSPFQQDNNRQQGQIYTGVAYQYDGECS